MNVLAQKSKQLKDKVKYNVSTRDKIIKMLL